MKSITSEMIDVEFDEKAILKQFRGFRKSTFWISKNIMKMRAKFPDQYIAVHNRKVVGSDADFDSLFNRLKGRYDMSEVTIEFIPSEEVILVL